MFEKKVIYYIMNIATADNYNEVLLQVYRRWSDKNPHMLKDYVDSVYALNGWKNLTNLLNPLRLERRERILNLSKAFNNTSVPPSKLIEPLDSYMKSIKDRNDRGVTESTLVKKHLHPPTFGMRSRLHSNTEENTENTENNA